MTERTIFRALSDVQSALSKQGIAKNQTNSHQRYKFRGIDDVLNTLAPILSESGVLVIPSVVDKEIKVGATKNGGVSSHAIVTVEYTLYDRFGDSITHKAYGEAIDTSDKAINKAFTAAYKYFLFQAFCIPIDGIEDADLSEPEQAAVQVETVSAKTLQTLLTLCAERGIEVSKYVQWAKVSTIEEIPEERALSIIEHLGKSDA